MRRIAEVGLALLVGGGLVLGVTVLTADDATQSQSAQSETAQPPPGESEQSSAALALGQDQVVGSDVFMQAWQRGQTTDHVVEGTLEIRRGDRVETQWVRRARQGTSSFEQTGGASQIVVDDLTQACTTVGGTTSCTEPTPAIALSARRAQILQVLESHTIYALTSAAGSTCFRVNAERLQDELTFGLTSEICFDDASGAQTKWHMVLGPDSERSFAAERVSATVTRADLEPS